MTLFPKLSLVIRTSMVPTAHSNPHLLGSSRLGPTHPPSGTLSYLPLGLQLLPTA